MSARDPFDFAHVPAVQNAQQAVIAARARMDALPSYSREWLSAQDEMLRLANELHHAQHAELKKTFPSHCPACGGDVEPAWGQCIRQCQRAPNHRNDWSD
jgi:hypothetical protein